MFSRGLLLETCYFQSKMILAYSCKSSLQLVHFYTIKLLKSIILTFQIHFASLDVPLFTYIFFLFFFYSNLIVFFLSSQSYEQILTTPFHFVADTSKQRQFKGNNFYLEVISISNFSRYFYKTRCIYKKMKMSRLVNEASVILPNIDLSQADIVLRLFIIRVLCAE